MANQLVEAMKIGEEKARREMQIAEDAYNEQWRDQVDWGPQDPEPGEPVFGTEEDGQTFFEFVKSLQINPELIAGFMDDLKIDPTAHKGAQKKTKIYNKATQGSGSEKDWLKKTGPQLPLASVPSSRTIRDHLKPGTKGLRPYDKSGGGRGISKEEWLKLIRSVPTA